MEVCWFEQSLEDISDSDDWLGARERSHLYTLRVPKRRADWRLGRWTAKHAVAQYLNMPCNLAVLAAIQIRPAPSGAPEVLIDDAPGEISISLSHSAGLAACAVTQPGTRVGCDVEIIEPRSDVFVADYFTTEEQEMIQQAPDAMRFAVITLIWSAKESALKAMGEGLRMNTRDVSVTTDSLDVPALRPNRQSILDSLPQFTRLPNGWQPLRVSVAKGTIFHGWWFYSAQMLRTLVSDPSPSFPVFEPR